MDASQRREILKLLEANARLTPAEIATMVGESTEAVTAAISEWEAQGAILQYTALIDWDKADADRVTAMIDVKITPQRDTGFDRVAERIAGFAEVRSCYLMSGGYDLLVEVEARTLKDVARFVAERLSTIAGVASTTTHFVLKPYKHDGVSFTRKESDERLAVTP